MATSPQPVRVQEIPRAAKEQRVSSKFLIVTAGALVMAVIASVAYTQIAQSRRGSRVGSNPVSRAVYPDPSTIGLSGMRAGRDIQITWNPQSSTFSNVKIGMLTIKDGGSQREIALTASELQARKLIYTPIGDRIEASLELFSPDRKSTRESVLFVLGPRQDTAPPLVAQQAPAPPREIASAPRATDTRSRTEPVAIPQIRGFTPPPVQRASPERIIMIEPPQPVAATMQSGTLPPAIVPLPSAPVPRQQPGASQGQKQLVVHAKARKPIRQVRAELPPNVIAMMRGPVHVEVRARIDASGKVVQAEPLSAVSVMNRYLGTAAVEAAKLWRFEPGEESTVILRFTFEPR